jgi:hypothetical protein
MTKGRGTKFETVYIYIKLLFWELIHGFRDNAFMKHSNGSLGAGDLYQGRVAVIKGSGFVN